MVAVLILVIIFCIIGLIDQGDDIKDLKKEVERLENKNETEEP